MDPIAFGVVLVVVAYVVYTPDPVSLSASRGSVGAIRSGGRSAVGSIRSDWGRSGAVRAKRRSERLDGWRKARTERDKKGRLVASPDERRRAAIGLSSAWAGDRSKAAVGSVGRAVKAGVLAMPAGYRDGVEKARSKRSGRSAPSKQPKVSAPSGGGEKGADVSAGNVARGAVKGARFVGKNAAELMNTGHLAHECKDVHQDIEQARTVLKGIRDYTGLLPERYAAAKFHTKGIAVGVGGVAEAEADLQRALKMLDDLDEHFMVIEKAIQESDTIGEAGSAQQAEGDVQAFQPA